MIERLSPDEIRKLSEVKLASISDISQVDLPEDMASIIHELRTHQIELEMQKEELQQIELELLEARDYYCDLYNFSPVGYVTLDYKLIIVDINRTFALMLGENRNNFLKTPFSSFVFDEDQDHYFHFSKRVFESHLKQNTELRLKRTDGSSFPVHLEISQVTNSDGSKSLFTAISDISEQRALKKAITQRTKELLESESKFKTLFTTSPDPTWIIDENNVFILCNEAAANTLEYNSIEELKSTHPSELSPEFQPDGQSSLNKANEMMACAHRKGIHRFEWEHRRSSGNCFPVEVTLSKFKMNGKDHLYCTWRDISTRKKNETELQKLNQQLEQLSLQDGLTSIANRRMFDSRLSIEWGRCMREKQPISLIISDVDFFKQYNDTYGHLQGDECLKTIAKEQSEMSRRSADLSARYGGEEFVLLFPNTNLIDATHLAERLRDKIYLLNIPHESSAISDWVTISAGVASMIPSKGVSSSSLIEAADKALYLAKEEGRNTVRSE
jgi:diguanylate cyclase (GGDEF)-like protein/PAS domain S-box-containing protein